MTIQTVLHLDILQVFVDCDEAVSFLEEDIWESCDGFLVTVHEFLLVLWCRCLPLPPPSPMPLSPGMQWPWWRHESDREDDQLSEDNDVWRFVLFCLCWMSAICCV